MSTTARKPSEAQSRAVVLEGQGQTRLESLPTRAPAPGEILLDLRCCGLCGTDLFKIAQPSPSVGSVLGHEVVGTVTRIGAGVDSVSMGDRVVSPHHVPCGRCHFCLNGSETLCQIFREDLISPGGFSETFILLPRAVERAARVLPSSLTDEAALFLEPSACVLRGIDRAGLPRGQSFSGQGQTALILGAGSMGLLHLLLLRALFPDLHIVVSDPIPGRRKMAQDLGATAAGAPENYDRQVADVSANRGADWVFDTVGRPDVLRQAIGSTREGSTVVLFAHAKPGQDLKLELNTLFKSERHLVGTYSGGPDEQARIWDLLVEGRLDPSPLVTHKLPLSRFQEGVDLVLAHQALKVLFVPDTEVNSEPA